jgi:hypothetical protein
VTINGYWFDNWIYWITISYTTRVQCITLYNSQQPSLFSCSEDPGSNCCNQLLWHPLPSLVINNSLTNCDWLTEDSSYIASGPDPKENISTLLCRTRPRRKLQLSHCCSSHCCVRVRCQATFTATPTACASQYCINNLWHRNAFDHEAIAPYLVLICRQII